MENTCNSKECKLFDLLGGTPEQCPNYIESWWTKDGTPPVLVKDCSPKRTLLMVQELYNRTITLQQSNEQQRNESAVITNIFNQMLEGKMKRQEVVYDIDHSST